MFKRKKNVVTHSGSFHPDDVFGVAVLSRVLKGNINVIRTRDEIVIKKADYALDVGGISNPETNRFDHHQEGGAGKRDNGVPYASFGLIWRKFGVEIAQSEECAAAIDKALVQYVDAMDNGFGELKPVYADAKPFTFGNFIMNLNPDGGASQGQYDYAFKKAVKIADQALMDLIAKENRKILAAGAIKTAYEKADDKRVILLDGFYPWDNVLNKFSEPLFVVEPGSSGGGWKVAAVRDNISAFENRKNLPSKWAGKRDQELADITGVSDAVFCHNQLFVAYAKSKEGALKLAKLAIS
jgi:uncharacterized UPF0160 family protein